MVRIILEATVDTPEQRLRPPVPPVYHVTSRTLLRCIRGIYPDNRDASFKTFVFYHRTELSERPAVEVRPVLLPSLDAVSYAREILQHHHIAFVKTVNEFSAYLMQDGICPSLLLTTKPFKLPLRRGSAYFLECLPLFPIMFPSRFYITPLSFKPVGSDKNISFANVHTHIIIPFGLGKLVSDGDVDIDVTISESDLGVLHGIIQELTLIVAYVKCGLHTPVEGSNRDSEIAVSEQGKEFLIQIHAELSELVLPVSVLLIRLRYAVTCPDCEIRGEFVALSYRSVGEMVQCDGVETPLGKSNLADVVAGISESYRSLSYLLRFLFRRAQLAHYRLCRFHDIHIGFLYIKSLMLKTREVRGRIPHTVKTVCLLRPCTMKITHIYL